MKKGDRVKVFDHRLYVNDTATPLSITMKSATILKVYKNKNNEEVADVEFDYKPGEISKGHFVWAIERDECDKL